MHPYVSANTKLKFEFNHIEIIITNL